VFLSLKFYYKLEARVLEEVINYKPVKLILIATPPGSTKKYKKNQITKI